MLAGLRLVSAALAALALSFAIAPGTAVHIRNNASPVTVPFARRVNATGIAKLLEVDRARAKSFKTGTRAAATPFQQNAAADVPVTNQAVDYVMTVTVGNPGKNFSLLIDTGSSNTWAGSRPTENPFVPLLGSASLPMNLVAVEYGSGSVMGIEVTDTLTFPSGLVIQKQSMGAALVSTGFTAVDGIIGFGPVGLTCGTLILGSSCIPTVTDNAFSEGSIPERMVGFSFAPTSTLDNTNGELTIGGVDDSKFTGPLNFVPITSTAPASQFVGIDQSITFGSPTGQTILPMTAGITDTGTTLLLIASDAFATYQSLTGGVLDPATGLLTITPDQFANLQSVFFNIGENSFEFTPNAQIWPRALNTAIGGTPGNIYLVINDVGTPTGSGLDFIDGMTFLERFYYVFDSGNNRVGLAETQLTRAEIN
ncbi:family A1 protease [Trametes versicolor FP-101664 SS1]|uniref:Family A1 protease n=1 Tax=Trametes versicolor (strain FP-101664) TaxID=717944 RepID=R7S7K7_TRAVS|nr:family A1 protease [Trametes versicolor FP-101664 SS1]EIW52038.1 family A1 protease [Trametes versicolor FP-101664 SS1]